MSNLWAFIERMVPRGGTAFVMLLLATVVPPAEVGIYALSMMLVMLVQTMTDGSIRGIAVSVVPTPQGQRFIAQYQWWASLLGTVVITGGLIGIWVFVADELKPVVWGAVPLIVMPVATAVRVRSVADLQLHDSWQRLARHQALATFLSLAVSIPILYATKNIVASSVQAVLTEALFTWVVIRAARKINLSFSEEQINEAMRRHPKKELFHISGYQMLGWFQSQADRFLVTFFAGPSALGQWSFAQNIARAAGDSLAGSTTNVIRPAIFSGDPVKERQRGQRILDRALAMTVIIEGLVVAISLLVLPQILSDQWAPAIQVVPLMALSCIVTTLNWPLSAYLLKANRISMASPVKLIGVILAIPIAWAAVHDFRLAAWLLVIRELVECFLLLVLTRHVVPWPAVIRFLGVVGCCTVVLVVLQALGG